MPIPSAATGPHRTRRATTALATAAVALCALVVLPAGPGGSAAAVGAGTSATSTPIYLDPSYSFAERAADLVSRMTLAEKVAQLRTNSAPAIPRLGVQQYTYWSEGQHGVNRINPASGAVGAVHATSFPTNFAASMSWDPALTYQETSAISDEARGLLDKSLFGTNQNNLGPSRDDYGYLTYWAPTVNLDRDPRWGRTDEAFGEDPYLVGRMAGAFVNGYQGQTIDGQATSKYLKVAATAKHYALNDVENNREQDSSDASDINIRDYYTAQFRSLVENAHVAGLMTSYNAVNGTPAPADTYTVNELAQRTYGFDNYTTSDCGAVHDIYAADRHDWAAPGWTTTTNPDGSTTWTNNSTGKQLPGAAGGQAYALRAGTQANCTGAEATLANITQAIDTGALDEGVLDNALVHLFTIRMRLGEFDSPGTVPYTSLTKAQLESPAHQALAQDVADKSLVLLKNDPVAGGTSTLLPADPSTLNKVVIVGDLANKVTLGGYSGAPTLQVSAVKGISDEVKAANPNASVVFDACGTSTRTTTPATCSVQTQSDISNADLVVVVVGTDGNIAGEGRDRSTIAMPGNYDSLINQVSAIGNHRMVLAVQSDGPVTIDDVQGKFPAVVFSGYNGESQGAALADVLLGKQNPSGHLNFTWYKDDTQLPDKKNYGLTPAETGGLGRTYQYFTGTPSYPFGYGGSYASFKYSQIKTSPAAVTADQQVNVHLDVTNTGARPGATVAQVYAVPPAAAGIQVPRERLVGFLKTRALQSGQTQSLAIPVRLPDVSFWDPQQQKQVVPDGTWQFRVASDAEHAAGTTTVSVTGAITPRVKYVTVQPDHVVFGPGQSLDLTGKNPWIKDDTAEAGQHVRADNIVEAVDNDQSFRNLTRAHVTYASSNPNVATVSNSGTLTTVAAGAATISVTVDGVTGSTPIVVQQPFSLTAAKIAAPGSSFTATTTLPNPSSAPLSNVTMSLTAPDGWTVQPTSPATFASVAPGQTASTTWSVAVPAGAAASTYQLSAKATFSDANGAGSSEDATSVALPFDSLAAAFDNPGISDDSDTAAGNLDGGGFSYSAQGLAAGNPSLTPGATFTHDGQTFTWPDAPAGSADNVVANGQTFALSGSGTKLGVVGACDYGDASGTGTITYADGSTQDFSLGYADWYSNAPSTGDDIVSTTPYLNARTGRNNHAVAVYYASVPLQADKTVRYVTLPTISNGVTSGQVAMHVFSVAVS